MASQNKLLGLRLDVTPASMKVITSTRVPPGSPFGDLGMSE